MNGRLLQWRLRVLVPIAMVLGGALCGATWFDNAVNRGITTVPAPRPIPWADVPPLGVNAFNLQYEPDRAVVARTLQMARDMGAHFVRLQFAWDDIEISGKGDFVDRRNQPQRDAWEKYDIIVSETTARGLEPIIRIDRTPKWARPNADTTERFQAGLAENGNSTGPPDSYADYADFVRLLVERYDGDGTDDAPGSPRARFFQIWNEPNLAYEWNWQIPDPVQFVSLLQQAYAAAKHANPEAVILFPSLSPTDGLEPRIAPMSELAYLDAVYNAGGAAFFDIMSAQAYGLGQPPDEHRYVRPRTLWHRPLDTRIDVSRLVLVREVMERHSDTNKAIWISEFGYNSAPADVPGVDQQQWAAARLAWGQPVSEDQKAAYLIGQLERARQEWPWIGTMNVWFLRWGGYQQPAPNDPTQYFAVVTRDFKPLPAYTALQTYSQAGIVAGVGAHMWANPAVQQTAATGWLVRFEGTHLYLVGKGSATVQIDDQPPQLITFDGSPQVIGSSLPDAIHQLTVQGDAPEVFVVARPSPWSMVGNIGIGVLVVLLMLVGAAIGRRLVGRIVEGKQ